MKKLKFSDKLIEQVLSEKKDITWRINDEKNIRIGDNISLCNNNEEEFTQAKVLSVKETTFWDMNEEDKKGHEKFSSNEEMYKTYSKYYNARIIPETKLKVIKFKINQNKKQVKMLLSSQIQH